jgi:ABC-type bacteriocin/lantibiotic exporter with double-glycine peptidase domain
LFLEVVKRNSLVKGCRWDDIVMKFEYMSIELPALQKSLEESRLSQDHKTHVLNHLRDHHDLDLKGL